MIAPELAAAAAAVIILAMIWLRTRLHYARQRRGILRLQRAGAIYFAAAAATLLCGWFVAPLLGRAFAPLALASTTLTRVVWFLASYYAFALVHHLLRSRGVELFAQADSL
jgi:hypothetical protein